MAAHGVPNDGQAQAGAPGRPGAGLIHTIKAVENMRLILGGNAGAVVRHGKHRLFTRAEYRHMDMTALRRILHGILHQIVHHLLQLRAVRRQQQTFRKVGGEPLSALFRHGLQTAQGGLCQLA